MTFQDAAAAVGGSHRPDAERARLGDARRTAPYDPPRANRRACTSERNAPLPSDIIGEPPACMPGEK